MGYRFDGSDFVVDNYNAMPPFSGFLPGVCGADGVPLWCCYVNRGQAVASFGADRKDGAIMEFAPAVAAYEDTVRKGFRTFLRVDGRIHEPFAPSGAGECTQTMRIGQNSFSLEETGTPCRLNTRVDCFLLPHERLGALVRRVTVTNAAAQTVDVELLDGMARVLPYGVKNSEFREMSNLLRSFFEVRETGRGEVLYSLRASAENDARVKKIARAHFCFASMNGRALPLICDPCAVYGQDTGYETPIEFSARGTGILRLPQSAWNKVACAMAAAEFSLAPRESRTLYFLAGITDSESRIDQYVVRLRSPEWLDEKCAEAEVLTKKLVSPMETHTSLPRFDLYLQQCWLDNVMRGGVPFLLGDKLIHLYSRRHGDLERDYNNFALSATHFSEGDGNFRDVCQNRRSDVLFFPDIGSREVVRFMELLQLDGYNSLELLPAQWRLPPEKDEHFFSLFSSTFPSSAAAEELATALHGGLSAGEMWRMIDTQEIAPCGEAEIRFFSQLALLCDELPRADFNDGNWIDHWTYVPDLINAYVRVFPEREHELVFDTPLRYCVARAHVRPLCAKLRMTEAGPRQYDAVEVMLPRNDSSWELDSSGELLISSLFSKLFLLSVLKCATLDPEQRGIEMEAGKPGWNDALNGLPGLFGSSVSECVDLLLLIRRLSRWADEMTYLALPQAVWKLALSLDAAAQDLEQKRVGRFAFWQRSLALREAWREHAYAGLFPDDWAETTVPAAELTALLCRLEGLVACGLSRTKGLSTPPPTYFVHTPEFSTEAVDFRHLCGFRVRPLPVFLEGPAKLLRLERGTEAKTLYRRIKGSGLYDKRLGMYKTCVSLEGEGFELGRIRAFTPGWFERESIFPHAEYKFLLALLRAELYEEFFSELQRLLPPFMDPSVYGRSVIENSSFIASSANPDKTLWGRGYIARLSGATAEVISMWVEMLLGESMFRLRNGELAFTMSPRLPGWMFDENGEVSFTYLGCRFCYINQERRNTWDGCAVEHMTVDGGEVSGDTLTQKQAQLLRSGKLGKVTAYLRTPVDNVHEASRLNQ